MPRSLISTGTSPFDSSLLGASADGTDAFFFTRDRLVPQDANGTLVKLYDARADGGFCPRPTAGRCKASDECHGAGTRARRAGGDQHAHRKPVATRKPGKLRSTQGQGQAQRRAAARRRTHRRGSTRRGSTAASATQTMRCQGSASPRRRHRRDRMLAAFSACARRSPREDDRILHLDHLDHRGRRSPRHRDLLHACLTRAIRRRRGTSIFNAPEGIFGNPQAIDRCTSLDFAQTQCPPTSQAGLITLHANYEGNPTTCSGTAPLYDLEPGRDQTALLRLHRADPQHPDPDPGHRPDRRPTTACASPSPTSPS